MLRKRNESSVVTQIMGYLQLLENSGKIAFYNRQQAGNLAFQRGGKWSRMRLGREGVADIWVMPFNRLAIWIECKLDNGKQNPAQKEFQRIAESAGNTYWIIHDCDELQRKFKEIGVLNGS